MLRFTGHKHLLLQVFDSGVKQSPIPAISRRSLRGGEELARDLVEEEEEVMMSIMLMMIMMIMMIIIKLMIMVILMIIMMTTLAQERRKKEEKKEGAVEKMKRLLRVDSDETDDLHDKYR